MKRALATTAMVLAAGRGERLRPFTDTCPKPLLPVAGRPLIEYHLIALARAGVERVVINASWLAERLPAALGDGSRFGLALEYSLEGPTALETGGGIRQALDRLGDPFLVLNGDVWSDFDPATLTLADADLATLVLVENPDHHPQGDFVLDGARIRAEGAPRLTFAGIGLYRRALFESHESGRFPLAPLLRTAMAADRVGGVHHRGVWINVDTAARRARLESQLTGGAG